LTGLLTGHCHLKGHQFKLGMVNSPVCETCQQASEMASHFLCDCEALAILRFRQLSCYFMKWERQCTLFKVWDCRMNEINSCTKGCTHLYLFLRHGKLTQFGGSETLNPGNIHRLATY